jgi:chemotaxis family two-component system response regulator Rcp1
MRTVDILLVEDNPGDVLLVREALRNHQIDNHIHVMSDGQTAVQYVATMGQPGQPRCPDLLILDLNLPKADGVDVLAEFRKHPECASTPVVIVTSSDSGKDRTRVAAFGIKHYFRKPSDLDEFMKLGALVKEVLASGAG